MFVRDVVIHTNHNIFPLPNTTLDSCPTPPDPFKLTDELWIGRVEADAAKLILELNEPTFYRLNKPVTQFAQLYSFVREKDGPSLPPYRWDEDSKLQSCVAISRLVQPTSVSLRYAARVRYNSDSTVADISPSDIRGVGVDTYLAKTPDRDWLTEADAVRLRQILRKLDSSPLPDRASRALWYHEYAVRTYYVEIRWVLVATALEAIVHVEQQHSTRQFKCRVSQLASELGVTGLGLSEAKRAYTHRSALAHGQKLGQLSEPDRQLYDSMETTLRLAILRAIEDDEFSSMLNNPEEIQKAWPL